MFEEKLPGSIDNFYAFTTTLKEAGEKADHSLEIVHAGLAETAAAVTESAMDFYIIVSEGIKMIIGALVRK